MTAHEQTCLNDALHKAKVRETELRVRRKLETKLSALTGMKADAQVSYLLTIEAALDRL